MCLDLVPAPNAVLETAQSADAAWNRALHSTVRCDGSYVAALRSKTNQVAVCHHFNIEGCNIAALPLNTLDADAIIVPEGGVRTECIANHARCVLSPGKYVEYFEVFESTLIYRSLQSAEVAPGSPRFVLPPATVFKHADGSLAFTLAVAPFVTEHMDVTHRCELFGTVKAALDAGMKANGVPTTRLFKDDEPESVMPLLHALLPALRPGNDIMICVLPEHASQGTFTTTFYYPEEPRAIPALGYVHNEELGYHDAEGNCSRVQDEEGFLVTNMGDDTAFTFAAAGGRDITPRPASEYVPDPFTAPVRMASGAMEIASCPEDADEMDNFFRFSPEKTADAYRRGCELLQRRALGAISDSLDAVLAGVPGWSGTLTDVQDLRLRNMQGEAVPLGVVQFSLRSMLNTVPSSQ